VEQRRRIGDITDSIRTAADATGELVGGSAHAEEVAGRLQRLAGELEALTRRAG
jgi:hypothetical protein